MISLWVVGFLVLCGFDFGFYIWCRFFHHSKCSFIHVYYFSVGVHLVLHLDCILSIFFYDGLSRIKAFMNALKCVTVNCQTKTDYGPFLSLFFFLRIKTSFFMMKFHLQCHNLQQR